MPYISFIKESGGLQSEVQSDKIGSDWFDPIISISLWDSQADNQGKFLSDDGK